MYKNLKIAGIIFILFSLIFGLLIRVFVVFYFTNFTGDQINDAYRTMGIWEGSFPTLGPGPAAWSGVSGKIYLPPLYYYLVFPGTALTPDLSSQAISNAFFTFLSIPLLIFTVYRLLENIDNRKRFFLASLAGLWYSFLFRNIVMSTGDSLAGNPVSIIFFLLSFILLYTYQLEAKLSSLVEILCWITYGVILAILTSLHFSTLFVMPVIFLISVVVYISRDPKKINRWLLPGIAIISAIVALIPYWIGEIARDWINTRTILSLVIDASSKEGYSVTFLQRIKAILRGYLDLGQDVYFIGHSWKSLAISLAFLFTVLVVGAVKFRGNKTIASLLLLTWIVFLYAYSSTDMERTYNPIFYKLLIYLAPLFLAICSLAYLDFSKRLEKLFITFIIFGMTISILINIKFHYNYVSGRYSMPRIPNTSDLAHVLNQIPERSTICHPAGRYRNIRIHQYTDRYVTQRKLNFVPECRSGYYFTYRKYESLGNFTMHSTKPFAEVYKQFDQDYTLFKETSLYYIYRLK